MEINQAIINITSPNNDIRQNSEVLINDYLQNKTKQFIEIILGNLNSNEHLLVEMSLLILQKNIILKQAIYETLNENELNFIAESCIKLLKPGINYSILKRLSEIIVNIYEKLKKMANLLNDLKNIDYKNDKNLKLFIAYSLELIAEFGIVNENVDYHPLFSNYFSELFEDTNIEVKVYTAKALCEFLSNIDNEQLLQNYKNCTPVLIDLLINSIKENQEIGAKMLKNLNNVILFKPKFFLEKYEELLNVLGDIIGTNSIDFNCRNLSVSIICTIAEMSKVFMRKSQTFVNKIIPVLIKTSTEIEMDTENWLQNKENLTESISESICSQSYELSLSLTISYFLPKSLPHLITGIKNDNWKFQAGCLNFLGNIIEGIGNKFNNDIPTILELLVPLLNHSNDIVFYQTLKVLGLLTLEYSPQIQSNYHQFIIKVILEKLKTTKYDRIKKIIISFLINYYRDMKEDENVINILEIYVKDLMEVLIKVIEYSYNNQKKDLLCETISLIGNLANTYCEKFEKYYDIIMPTIINFIQNPQFDSNSKVSCIETTGFMLATLKGNLNNRYLEFNNLFEIVFNLLKNLEFDDTLQKPIFYLFRNLCSHLKENFFNFVEKLFPYLYNLSIQDVKLMINDTNAENDSKLKTMKLNYKIYGEKSISLNQNLVENKYAAMSLLTFIIKIFKEKILKYNQQLFDIVNKNIDSLYNNSRIYSYKILYNLMVYSNNQEEIETLNSKYLPSLLTKFNQNLETKDIDKVNVLLKCMHKLLKYQKIPFKNNQIVEEILNLMVKVFELNRMLVKDLENELQDGSDEEFVEEIKEEISIVNDALNNLLDINKDLIIIYKENIENEIINKFGNSFNQLLNDEKNKENVELGFLFISDLIEVGSDKIFNMIYNESFKKCIYYFNHYKTSYFNYQNINFILGNLCYRLDTENFKTIKNDVMMVLNETFNMNNGNVDEQNHIKDNAIACFGKVTLKHEPSFLNDFLNKLPLINDLEESRLINKILLEKIESDSSYFNNSMDALKQALNRISQCKKDVLEENSKVLLLKYISN